MMTQVTVLTCKGLNENGDDETRIVRIFDTPESCERYIVLLIRADQMTELEGLAMKTHRVYHEDR